MVACLQARQVDTFITDSLLHITDKIKKGDVLVEHRGTEEIWADGNTKPLQGAGFRLFRSKVMGTPEDHDDDAERVRTIRSYYPSPIKLEWYPQDLQVLAKALGAKGQGHDRRKGLTPSVTPAPPGRGRVLDNDKFWPGNRPGWDGTNSRFASIVKSSRSRESRSRQTEGVDPISDARTAGAKECVGQ